MDRAAAMAVALSLASFPFLLPHVVEDFEWGIARRIGLPPGILAALLGFGLAAQVLGVALAAQGRAAGLGIIATAGAVWTFGGLWDHGLPLLLFGLGFRGHLLSALWALGLIVTQALAAASALAGLRAMLRSQRHGRPPAA
jgi:hypothetical protein